MAKKPPLATDPSVASGDGESAVVEIPQDTPLAEAAIVALDEAGVNQDAITALDATGLPPEAVEALKADLAGTPVVAEGEKLFFPFTTLQLGYVDGVAQMHPAEQLIALPAAEVDRLVALGVGCDPDAPAQPAAGA